MLPETWTDLLDPANRRGHPLLAAILYAFCPAAARWWIAGADPAAPFDPLVQAHRMRASGRTLRQVLEDWGLGELTGHARKYVDQVEAFRKQPQHRHLTAPELLPTFQGGRLEIAVRHGLAQAFEAIGGWRNFYPFVRAWAFSLRDWQHALGWAAVTRLEPARIVSTSLTEEAAALSAWKLHGGDRSAVGLPASDAAGRHGWVTDIYSSCLTPRDGDLVLLSEAGTVDRLQARFSAPLLRKLLERLSAIAQHGPYPPANALRDPTACARCGFRRLCWTENGFELTPPAMAF